MARGEKRNGTLTAIMLLMTIITLVSMVCTGFLLYDKMHEEPEAEEEPVVEDTETGVSYTEEEMEAILEAAVEETAVRSRSEGADEFRSYVLSSMSADKAYLATLRKICTEFIIYNDSDGLNFTPVQYTLKMNSLSEGEFSVNEDGSMDYYEGDTIVSHKGIDVSKFQGNIDWEKVAADGVEFAFVRCGFRGWGSAGSMNADDMFAANADGARAAGLHVGVYFYSTAITQEEIDEEVRFVLDAIEGHDIDYPIVIDTEKADGDGRADNLDKNTRTDLILSFCRQIEEAGYTPMIYANLTWFVKKMDLSRLEDYDKWFARYDTTLYYPYDTSIWQYSASGTVDGIDGYVDMNMSFREW